MVELCIFFSVKQSVWSKLCGSSLVSEFFYLLLSKLDMLSMSSLLPFMCDDAHPVYGDDIHPDDDTHYVHGVAWSFPSYSC